MFTVALQDHSGFSLGFNVETVICSHSTQPVMPGPAATEGRAKKKNHAPERCPVAT